MSPTVAAQSVIRVGGRRVVIINEHKVPEETTIEKWLATEEA